MAPIKGRALVAVFYISLIAGTGLITYVSVQRGQAKRDDGEFFPYLSCLGISSPEILDAEERGEKIQLRMVGVDAPSRQPELLNGLDPAQEDAISVKTLLAYIYKRRLRFHSAGDLPENPAEGLRQGYVEVYGIDVGRKLIENGQAFAADIEHPRKELYLQMQAKAKAAKLGVWRRHPAGPNVSS